MLFLAHRKKVCNVKVRCSEMPLLIYICTSRYMRRLKTVRRATDCGRDSMDAGLPNTAISDKTCPALSGTGADACRSGDAFNADCVPNVVQCPRCMSYTFGSASKRYGRLCSGSVDVRRQYTLYMPGRDGIRHQQHTSLVLPDLPFLDLSDIIRRPKTLR